MKKLIFVLTTTIVFISCNYETPKWMKCEYHIEHFTGDSVYPENYYTNSYNTINGCIEFIDHYRSNNGIRTRICGNFKITLNK